MPTLPVLAMVERNISGSLLILQSHILMLMLMARASINPEWSFILTIPRCICSVNPQHVHLQELLHPPYSV